MTLIEIFETLTCCSTSLDKEILRVSGEINNLRQEGIKITRHNLSKDPQSFIDNKIINDYISEHGVKELPITIVNNKIVKLKSYPTSDDFSEWTGVSISKSPDESDGKNCSCGCN